MKDDINKNLTILNTLVVLAVALIGLGAWTGAIEVRVQEHTKYKELSEPTRVDAIKALEGISVQLENNSRIMQEMKEQSKQADDKLYDLLRTHVTDPTIHSQGIQTLREEFKQFHE